VRGVASLGELIINSLDEGCASEIKFISNSKYATLSEQREQRDVVRSRFGDSRGKGTESLLEEGTESLFVYISINFAFSTSSTLGGEFVSHAAGRGDSPFSARTPVAEILRYCLDNHIFGLDG
jgi:hypothetical protein